MEGRGSQKTTFKPRLPTHQPSPCDAGTKPAPQAGSLKWQLVKAEGKPPFHPQPGAVCGCDVSLVAVEPELGKHWGLCFFQGDLFPCVAPP